MPLQYTNRRGEVYFIQSRERAGKVAYSATRKPSGAVLDSLPEGYEIRELPENAQVFIRRIKASKILPFERQLLEHSVRTSAKLENFIVDVGLDSLVVYVSDADPDASLNILRAVAPMTPEQAKSTRDYMVSRSRFDKMMRFRLADTAARHFNVERWCFLGDIDGWYFLDGGLPLATMAEKYVKHLGRESFFELT